MRRVPLASLIVLAGIVRAAEVAPSASPVTPPRSGSIESTTSSDQTAPPAKRVLSPDTAAKLAAASPKFVPATVEPTPGESPLSPVAREPDKPRNGIVRLPRFVVEEPKLHVPDSMQVLTPKGRVDLAFKRRPGLRMVPFAWMNTRIATEMLEDDLQWERRMKTAELLNLYLIRETDSAESARIERTKTQ